MQAHHNILVFFTVLASALTTGCQSLPENPPPTVSSVDLNSYTGLWYEIARLPVPFQEADERATARYSLNDAGDIAIVNTAIAPDGEKRSATGTAVPVDDSNNTKLKVTIDNFFAKLFGSPPDFGNYWILKIEPDYSLALVGSPDRGTLWLLSRETEISQELFNSYLKYAESIGFETQTMILNNGRF